MPRFKQIVLRCILHSARWLGLFTLARWVTRRDLRILCYHGAEIGDESCFRPTLFMTGDQFARRMQFLAESRYPVLPLTEALERMDARTLPDCATVITIDDGWYGTFVHQAPALRRFGFPATLYLSTYYLINQTQVFNVALQYIAWKANASPSKLASFLRAENDQAVTEAKIVDMDSAIEAINDYAERLDGAEARQALLRRICEAVDFDWASMEAMRQFAFMSREEASALAKNGIDLQLHTHRHRYPEDFISAKQELVENRAVLAQITEEQSRHFCYPSGVYTPESRRFLSKLDVDSATTVKPGFNREGCSRFELTRFIDGERVSELEFAAEMSGFFELIRRVGYKI